jgi:hypothetical protein
VPNGAGAIRAYVHADAPEGFPNEVVDIVRNNLRNLGFPAGSARFEEE